MEKLDYSSFSDSEVLSIAKALYYYEIELKYYIKILSNVFPENHLILKRSKFILDNIKQEQKEIYFKYQNSELSLAFISYVWYHG